MLRHILLILASAICVSCNIASGLDITAPAQIASQSQTPSWEPPTAAFGSGVASSVILSMQAPEAAFAQAAILNTRLHGNVGEELVSSLLHTTGGWESLAARDAPQGLDHLWMKYNKHGVPCDLIVGETKYGTSRLGMTKLGRQMSSEWISPKLAARAKWYEAKAGEEARQLGRNHSFLERRYRLTAAYLKGAAEGRIGFRSEILRVRIKENDAIFTLARLDSDGRPIGRPREIAPIAIKGRPANIVKAQMIKEIRAANPIMSQAEQRAMAETMLAMAKDTEAAISAKSAMGRLAVISVRTMVAAGLFAGVLDLAVQLCDGDAIDWPQICKMSALGTSSAAATEITSITISRLLAQNYQLHSATIALGRSMHLLPTQSLSLAPKAIGGLAGALAFAYGGYALGLYDVEEAHKTAIAGVAGTAMGGLAYSGMMAAASAWGTASTGTAIATLHGAAAESASLAWFGGGAASAGGGGVAWGTAVVGGVVVIVAASMTAAVMYGIHLHDAAEDWRRVGNTASVLRDHAGDYPGNPWARPNTSALF